MHVVDKFRTLNGPLKFCVDLEADWLIILKVAANHMDWTDKENLEQ